MCTAWSILKFKTVQLVDCLYHCLNPKTRNQSTTKHDKCSKIHNSRTRLMNVHMCNTFTNVFYTQNETSEKKSIFDQCAQLFPFSLGCCFLKDWTQTETHRPDHNWAFFVIAFRERKNQEKLPKNKPWLPSIATDSLWPAGEVHLHEERKGNLYMYRHWTHLWMLPQVKQRKT